MVVCGRSSVTACTATIAQQDTQPYDKDRSPPKVLNNIFARHLVAAYQGSYYRRGARMLLCWSPESATAVATCTAACVCFKPQIRPCQLLQTLNEASYKGGTAAWCLKSSRSIWFIRWVETVRIRPLARASQTGPIRACPMAAGSGITLLSCSIALDRQLDCWLCPSVPATQRCGTPCSRRVRADAFS